MFCGYWDMGHVYFGVLYWPLTIHCHENISDINYTSAWHIWGCVFAATDPMHVISGNAAIPTNSMPKIWVTRLKTSGPVISACASECFSTPTNVMLPGINFPWIITIADHLTLIRQGHFRRHFATADPETTMPSSGVAATHLSDTRVSIRGGNEQEFDRLLGRSRGNQGAVCGTLTSVITVLTSGGSRAGVL